MGGRDEDGKEPGGASIQVVEGAAQHLQFVGRMFAHLQVHLTLMYQNVS